MKEICVKEGAATASVADQDKIAALFPNTYGKPFKYFEANREKWAVETCFTCPGVTHFSPTRDP